MGGETTRELRLLEQGVREQWWDLPDEIFTAGPRACVEVIASKHPETHEKAGQYIYRWRERARAWDILLRMTAQNISQHPAAQQLDVSVTQRLEFDVELAEQLPREELRQIAEAMQLVRGRVGQNGRNGNGRSGGA
jgi:hypothetical protein